MRRATTGALVAAVPMMVFALAGCNRTDPQQSATDAAAPAASPSTSAEPRGATDLVTAVQARFYSDDAIRGQEIEVSAESGTVTLRGTVPTDAAKQQAVNIARSVEGVTAVNDQIEVRATAASRNEGEEPGAGAATGTTGRTAEARQPWWITTKIQAQYFADADVKPWNIDVTTSSGGVVTLEGRVESTEAKNEAVRIARETEGVTRVEDRLRVEPAAPRTDAGGKAADPAAIGQPDARVTAKIQAKYFLDDDVKARNIDIDTRNGVVTLKGTVGTEAERRQAVALARNTYGVREVTDNLRVDTTLTASESTSADRGPASGGERTGAAQGTADRAAAGTTRDRPDAWITMKIQSKYFLDADVKGHQIDVNTMDGVVTLKGRVENAQQKQEAEQIARETEGVARVNNQLAIGAEPASS